MIRNKEIFRGTVFLLKRHCGKSNCRCRDGALHETWVLSYSVKNRTKMLPLQNKDLQRVKKGIDLYNKELSRLDNKALRNIEKLRKKNISARKGGK